MQNLRSTKTGLSLLVLSLILIFGCSPQPIDVKVQITEANQSFMEAFNSQDAQKMADNYTSDGKLFPPNSDVIEGKEAIKDFWQHVMDMGIIKAELKTIEATSYGKTAIERGEYKLYVETETLVDQGKYIVIWQKQDGQWKLHLDIWNSSNPLP